MPIGRERAYTPYNRRQQHEILQSAPRKASPSCTREFHNPEQLPLIFDCLTVFREDQRPFSAQFIQITHYLHGGTAHTPTCPRPLGSSGLPFSWQNPLGPFPVPPGSSLSHYRWIRQS
ncbi:unnamed protein product [Penicillium nalgiovense]|nr:unnamed protein product [Penicillium nalgiovense]